VLEPVFTPSGKIAVAAAVGKHGQQILIDGRSICRHPGPSVAIPRASER